MSLFSKKSESSNELEDYSTLTLPFIDDDASAEKAPEPVTLNIKAEPSVSPSVEKKTRQEDIKVYPAGISPLDALKKKINANTAEVAKEIAPDPDRPQKNKPENINPISEDKKLNKLAEELNPKKEETIASVASESPLIELRVEKPKQSLLKRCMPYIYDDDGVSQIDTKPDYVLESVEDIIKSAEQRAEEKIAKLYKLSDNSQNPVKLEKLETSFKAKPAASDVMTSTSVDPNTEKIPLPSSADILFDDFSGKRTVVTPTESITTTYSRLTDLQTGITNFAEEKTVVMPAIKTPKPETMEDIVSHTMPVNIKDAPAIKAQKPIAVTVKNDDAIPEVDDDYRSPDDTRRIGMKLKKARRSAFFRLALLLFTTVTSAVFALILPDSLFDDIYFLPCLVQFGLLCISAFANINIFASFKTMFTKRTSASAPVALAVSGMLVYMIYGLIFGVYPSDPVLLSLITLTAYDFFDYKRTTTVLNNFRIVASRSEKKAVSLIDDQMTATSMARSSIEGEVLVAGVKRTSTLTDFLKFTSCDTPFGGHLGTVMAAFSVIAVILGVMIGVSYRAFDAGLCAAALIFNIFAMPTFSVAEFLPFSDLSKKLYRLGAMVCGKYSASRIEQANAVVVTSAELFPEGSIELFNMKPLGANNIDNTLTAAASIAEAAKSPLISVFETFVDPAEKRPSADTVKYEDNLGISGWVGDDHYFIGNRTLMEAHGIKVPPLEVDRKILHRGYFPVYVAKGQRACALLIVKYHADRRVRAELARLVNAGITLLIDNCDSNITAEMLSDYFAIYPDSIKIMDHKGVHNYKTVTNYSEYYSAHAAYIGKPAGFFAVINGALKLRTVSNIMYALHIVLSAVVCVIFALASLDGQMTLMHISITALIELISTAAAVLTYYITRR